MATDVSREKETLLDEAEKGLRVAAGDYFRGRASQGCYGNPDFSVLALAAQGLCRALGWQPREGHEVMVQVAELCPGYRNVRLPVPGGHWTKLDEDAVRAFVGSSDPGEYRGRFEKVVPDPPKRRRVRPYSYNEAWWRCPLCFNVQRRTIKECSNCDVDFGPEMPAPEPVEV